MPISSPRMRPSPPETELGQGGFSKSSMMFTPWGTVGTASGGAAGELGRQGCR